MPLSYRTISCSDTFQLAQVFEEKHQATVIKDFFSAEVIKKILQVVEKIPEGSMAYTPRGFNAPCNFAQIAEFGIEGYVDSHTLFKNFIEEQLPTIKEVIERFFISLKGTNILQPLKVQHNGKPFHSSPFSFRKIKSDNAGMHLHCHNQLHELNPDFAAHSIDSIYTENDISFFILLQQPEKGGELEIYDIAWQWGQRNSGNEAIIQPDGSRIDSVGTRSLTIPLQVGDMVIFESGTTWHKINAVSGDMPRITMGGFFSKSESDNRILYYYT